MEFSGQLHAPASLITGQNHRYALDNGWLGPRFGSDAVEKRKILICRESNPDFGGRIILKYILEK
jgi:hypothetical protein